jgi:hypothetical protein
VIDYFGQDFSLLDAKSFLVISARQRRPHYTLFVYFSDESVPTQPMEGANDKVNSKRVDKGQLERVKQVRERSQWRQLCN